MNKNNFPRLPQCMSRRLLRPTVLCMTMALSMPVLLLQGCTQMPTEKQSVSDMRPQIAFKADTARHSARVIIDGLDMGALGAYLEGTAALRLVPGTHQLRVQQGTQVLLDEKFYVGDGVNRTFIVQ
jgi:hypothetical protein